jgi:hypothetical protein
MQADYTTLTRGKIPWLTREEHRYARRYNLMSTLLETFHPYDLIVEPPVARDNQEICIRLWAELLVQLLQNEQPQTRSGQPSDRQIGDRQPPCKAE